MRISIILLLSFVIISHCKDIRKLKFNGIGRGINGFKKRAEEFSRIRKIRDTENTYYTPLELSADIISERGKRCVTSRLGSTLSSRLGYPKSELSEDKGKKGRKLYETLCKACVKKNNCEYLNDCPLCEKWCIQGASICDNENDSNVDPRLEDTPSDDIISSRSNFENNPNTYTVTMTNGPLMEIILNLLSVWDTKSVEYVTITVKGTKHKPMVFDSPDNEKIKQSVLNAINEKKLTKNEYFLEQNEIEKIISDTLEKLHSKNTDDAKTNENPQLQLTLRDSESENVMHQMINPDVIEEAPDMSSIVGTPLLLNKDPENLQMLNRNSGGDLNILHQDQPRNQIFSDSLQNQPNLVGDTNPLPEDKESVSQSSAAFSTPDNIKTIEINPELKSSENVDMRDSNNMQNMNPALTNNMAIPTEKFMRIPHHHHHHHHHHTLSRSGNPTNEIPSAGTLNPSSEFDKRIGESDRLLALTQPQQQQHPHFSNNLPQFTNNQLTPQEQPLDKRLPFESVFPLFFRRSNIPISTGQEMEANNPSTEGTKQEFIIQTDNVPNLDSKASEMVSLPEPIISSQQNVEGNSEVGEHHHHHHHHWHSSKFEPNENDETYTSDPKLNQNDLIVEPPALYSESNDLSKNLKKPIQPEAREHHHHHHHHHWHQPNFRTNNNGDGSFENMMISSPGDTQDFNEKTPILGVSSPDNIISDVFSQNVLDQKSAPLLESPTEKFKPLSIKAENPSEQELWEPLQVRVSTTENSVENPIQLSQDESLKMLRNESPLPLKETFKPSNMESSKESLEEETETTSRKTKLGAKANALLKKIKDRQDEKLAKIARTRENIASQRKATEESIRKGLPIDSSNAQAEVIQEPVVNTIESAQLALEKLQDLTTTKDPDIDNLGSQPLDNSWEMRLDDSLNHKNPKATETLEAINEIEENPNISIRGRIQDGTEASNTLGRLIPSSRDMQISYKGPSDIYFVGNGIKLPLQIDKQPDGTLELSVDIEKLCSCHNISCPKDHSTLERAVGEILERNAELQEQLENSDDTSSGMPAPNMNQEMVDNLNGLNQNSFVDLKNRIANKFDEEKVTRERRSTVKNIERSSMETPKQEEISNDTRVKVKNFLKEVLGKSVEDLRNKMSKKTRFSTSPQKESTMEENVIPINKYYKFKDMEERISNNIDKTVDNFSKMDNVLLENESDILRRINEDPLIRHEVGIISDLLSFFKTLAVDNNNDNDI
ncbi:uncharacterized protein LOC130891511 [Diorhabda carinulata]|uniref:uncharacterized protein LOC130891511 n=1 Tax=Diorhabda carinulata TaxID=1163345 RepID=UPI0025A0A3C1|nr:uncharacterized protein LOC130891511 [Diorhabda carinulata]